MFYASGISLMGVSLFIQGLAIFYYWKYDHSDNVRPTPWWMITLLISTYGLLGMILYLWLANYLVGWTQSEEQMLLGFVIVYNLVIGLLSFRYKKIVFLGSIIIVLQGVLALLFWFIHDFGAV